jgi:hypothetical protein
MSTHQHYKQDPAKPFPSIGKPPNPKKLWTAAQAAAIAEATRINQEADRALQVIRDRMLQRALANKNPEDDTLALEENEAQLQVTVDDLWKAMGEELVHNRKIL